ncbi:hypothetical protein [Actinacidiphila sp. ITFR-21]|uniref:hypothetical protein n=1 Tax=Actinacidiphila sp. ITFR-21 TaxID=3075199 RepID=UPI00288C2D90|nr:hypothetical protein [Streptomyces sp. ITFR-21]WNI15234.1 hypothetical protein RLT57_06575 [Streptomyces sp. ITFR-21]
MSDCRIPGCSGSWHDDEICDVVLADLAGPGTALITEVSVGTTEPAELIVWEAEDGDNLFRTRDGAEALKFAAKLRQLAAAVERGAPLLGTQEEPRYLVAGYVNGVYQGPCYDETIGR